MIYVIKIFNVHYNLAFLYELIFIITFQTPEFHENILVYIRVFHKLLFSRHFSESESVFEKYTLYIRSRDIGCLMNFMKTFNWHKS